MRKEYFLSDFVSQCFEASPTINTDKITRDFITELKRLNNSDIEEILLFSGFIPDLYLPDSNQETLYSKLCEILLAYWANQMGFSGTCIKQKASYEDVKIETEKGIIVCDAKAFRLGRSQAAPNVKDFIKLEDIRKWLSRYKDNKIGGLVTYPDTHEWSSSSDAYQYCSTKDIPTVMLPYKYLSLILHFKSNFNALDLLNLWNYNKLFPNPLKKN